MRIPSFILIKKLLFAMSILRRVLIERVKDFNDNMDIENMYSSPTYDILKDAKKLGVFNMICDICINGKTAMAKSVWSKCLWGKAWQLEDIYLSSTSMLHKDNDLLVKTVAKARYLSWWQLSDKYPF